MSDLFAQGGAGGVGALLGAFFSWLGFKQRLDAQDKRIDTLADDVMYKDTCAATTKGIEQQLKDIKAFLEKKL